MREPYYNEKRQSWYIWLKGKQTRLTDREQRGPKEETRKAAYDRWHALEDKKSSFRAPGLKVIALLHEFLEFVKANKVPGTFEWYGRYCSSFAQFIGKQKRVIDLKGADVEKWIRQRYAASTNNTTHGAIRAVQRAFNWAIRHDLVAVSPVRNVEKPTPTSREIFVSSFEFAEVIEQATDKNERDLFTFLWETGCRVQEARRLTEAQFNPGERRFEITPSQAKGKRATRIIYLNDAALEIATRLAARHRSGAIFRNSEGEPWTKNAITCRFRKFERQIIETCDFCKQNKAIGRVRTEYRTKAERKARTKHICASCVVQRSYERHQLIKFPPYLPGLCATAFRHSFITNALVNGVDSVTVAVLTGHVDIKMISRVYGHLSKKPEFLLSQLRKATGSEVAVPNT